MAHSSRRMPRALCDGRAGGRRAMGLRRGRAHANAKEGETNRGRAAKKRTRRGQTAQGARGAWPMPRQRAKEAETATANRARGPRRLRATRGRHAQRRRIGALFAAERRARGCRRFRIESALMPACGRAVSDAAGDRRHAPRHVSAHAPREAGRRERCAARSRPITSIGFEHRTHAARPRPKPPRVSRTPRATLARRHERAFQTSVRRARRGPSAAPGRFSPRSAIRPSA
ncbi:Uncharacterised protein [Burkholderia pseudomallei]|nr:Uncharacterised protein [Burkholderia pseudomallei]CAJ2839620.1 Uncharacterised protein [Burkholderia pseudomallei]CAJ2870582.1 Uncharacterised protein [Burkholderia pseudomallei]CAJ2932978.1 Uncharacterised protein [Burkholderia pseudomallei]CAJ2936674.1 Uncharacterised protein [Burkholderia pseudomallei]